jgi:hypothetical protein
MSVPGAGVAGARYQADDTVGSVDEQSWSFDSDAEGTLPDGMEVLSQPRFLNGQLVVEATDDAYTARRPGLWTKADSVTCFDDVRLSAS